MTHPAQLARETALHNCRVFASHDMDVTRAGVSRLMNPYFVEYAERPADCEAHLDFLEVRGLAIAAIKQLGHMRINVAPIEGYHFLIFCLKGRALLSSSHGEATIDARTGLYFGPGQRFQGDLPEDCEQLVVRIDEAAFQSFAGPSNTGLRAFVDLSQPELGPWLHLLNAMISDPSAIDLLQRNDHIATDYEQLFMSLLFSGQGYSRTPSEGAGYKGAAPASIRRAEMFIEANAREMLRLDDIAAAANVPVRTLLDGFRRFRQTSPGRFLRDIRLDRAHERLLKSGDEASVTAIALEAGFTHLGRFARDYADRFGVKPSDTLARSSKPRSARLRRD
ncbi:MAG: hypothetical protein JWN69_2151 [Alphaproteobacteria bacterium]|nr:hypothetical protein [Alphaproteobacteria bacterium]